jgi:hypothetical protein
LPIVNLEIISDFLFFKKLIVVAIEALSAKAMMQPGKRSKMPDKSRHPVPLAMD